MDWSFTRMPFERYDPIIGGCIVNSKRSCTGKNLKCYRNYMKNCLIRSVYTDAKQRKVKQTKWKLLITSSTRSGIPDDWGAARWWGPSGNLSRHFGHLSVEGWGMHHHDEAARRWCRRLVRCELSRLRYHGHSLLLSSYLCRIKLKENSCSACGHQLPDLTHLLDCSASEPLRRAIFGTTSSIFDFWSRPWSMTDCIGSPPYSSALLSSEGVGQQHNHHEKRKDTLIFSITKN